MALATEAQLRGHLLHLFCHEPVHPQVTATFEASGARIERLSNLSVRPWAAARRLARGFDVVQLNAIAPRSRLALVAYGAWPARVLYVDHNSGPPGAETPVRPRLLRLLDRLTVVRVDQMAGVSGYVHRRLERRFRLPTHRVRTLYGGVNTDRFRPPEPRGHTGAYLRICAVAALIQEKGIAVLLQALTTVDNCEWYLTIAGDGPDRPRLEGIANALGIAERVAFLGVRDDVDELLRDCDVFVHPAVWQEALGYTILEGMASGCCVLASRVGGIPEIIRHEREGLLVEAGDVAGLAAQLIRVAADQDLRARLGMAARKRILDGFTLEASVKATFDWIEEVAG